MSKKEKNKANNAKCKKVTVGNCAYFTKRINLNKNDWHKCPVDVYCKQEVYYFRNGIQFKKRNTSKNIMVYNL